MNFLSIFMAKTDGSQNHKLIKIVFDNVAGEVLSQDRCFITNIEKIYPPIAFTISSHENISDFLARKDFKRLLGRINAYRICYYEKLNTDERELSVYAVEFYNVKIRNINKL